MHALTVVNMKCDGCESRIRSALAKAGLTHISVDAASQRISFEGDAAVARAVLSGLGYPEAGTSQAESLLKKGHSYLSCAIGRIVSHPDEHTRLHDRIIRSVE